jgi:VWFA-related protein
MKKLRLVPLLCVAALIGPGVLPVHAQDTGAGLVLRSETRVVLVDAVTVDKKGKFIRDLTQKDFRIWEDGKEQKIGSFSLESSGVNPERPSKHYIAMLFDTSAGQASQIATRQEAMRFVDGFASPDRYMAVTSYNPNGELHVTQNFTTDRDQLRKALSRVSAGSNSIPVSSAPEARRLARGGAVAAQAADTVTYRNLLLSLRNMANSLAPIRGRKALIFFTNGIPLPSEFAADLQATINAANKANVAIYTVGPPPGGSGSGTGSIGASASSSGSSNKATPPPDTQDQNIIRSLADGTGGLALFTTNDLANSLGEVAQEQDEYYLLGYTPAVDSPEDSCHELRVKVDRGGLEVRARKGYCTSKATDVLSGKPVGKDLEAKAAGSAAGNMTAKMQLPWFYSAPNVARVNLAMDIIPSAVKFQKEKGKFQGEFDLAGVAYEADGGVAARVSDAVKLEFDSQQQVDAFLKTPYHYQNQFDIAPGQYTFRMAFSSDSSGAQGFGKVEMPLTIDPWNGRTLSISGLALSHDAHPAADLTAGLDVSLLERSRPLVSGGAEAVPTGSAQFHAGEPGYFYFEAYEPLLAAAKPDAAIPLVGVRIRVLDRATGQQKQDTGVKLVGNYEKRGNPAIPIISPLPVANLPPGAYRLEVSVLRETGNPVVRTTDFDIN